MLQRLSEYRLEVTLILVLFGVFGFFAYLGAGLAPMFLPISEPEGPIGETAVPFDGESAFQYVQEQVQLGPRPTGSAANEATSAYIAAVLEAHGWRVDSHEFAVADNTTARNVWGVAGPDDAPAVTVGTNYDTRLFADKDPDPDNHEEPVLGANGSASGVAVLLELARALDKDRLSLQVWLVFFDAEDNAGIGEWELAMGSSYFVEQLTVQPESAIIVDRVGDLEQEIYFERNSDVEVMDALWGVAAELGYGQWIVPEYKWSLPERHSPFTNAGILSVLFADFDYRYWHTVEDTLDKVAPESLERTGRTLQIFLETR